MFRSPKEAGKVYLIRAQKILAEIQDARSEICHLEVKPHGILRLGIPNSFNSVAFVKHLISFSEKYPKIQLQVSGRNFSNSFVGRLCRFTD
jgi:DNA-binding transcriptional LysR family regulator